MPKIEKMSLLKKAIWIEERKNSDHFAKNIGEKGSPVQYCQVVIGEKLLCGEKHKTLVIIYSFLPH